MRVMVLGAGVIGTSCAYYLARAGHEVVVVDRQRGPALETSFANAGGICVRITTELRRPASRGDVVRIT